MNYLKVVQVFVRTPSWGSVDQFRVEINTLEGARCFNPLSGGARTMICESKARARQITEPVNGRLLDGQAKLVYLHCRFIDQEGQKFFNTGVLLDRSGDLIVRYQKQFLTTHDPNWLEFGVSSTGGCHPGLQPCASAC